MTTSSPPDLAAVKGVVLAAGVGSRMRPFTEIRPKPLLQFCGVPILYLALWRLKKAGIKRIKVNAHHLWRQIESAVAECNLELDLSIAYEKEKLLGTGGVYRSIDEWRGGADLLCLNGDVVSDLDLKKLLDFHKEARPLATMALLPKSHTGETSVWQRRGRVVAIGGEKPAGQDVTGHTFACAQILSDELLSRVPAHYPSEIISVYKQALANNEFIAAQVQRPFWFDLGKPERYLKAHRELLNKEAGFDELQRRIGIEQVADLIGKKSIYFPPGEHVFQKATVQGPALLSSSCTIHPSAKVGPNSVISERAVLERNVEVRNSLVMEETEIKKGTSLKNSVVNAGNVVCIN